MGALQSLVGVGRALPPESRSIALDELDWRPLPDGTRAARIEVASAGAAALRIALVLTAEASDVVVRFAGNTRGAQSFGPVSARTIIDDAARFGAYWSPVLEGDGATIELQTRAVANGLGAKIAIPRLSHHLLASAAFQQKNVSDIGRSGSCNIDVACAAPSAAFVNSTKAVVKIVYTQDDGTANLCSGTLLNDATSSNTPYLYTASYCVQSASVARTLVTYWFFDAVSCGSNAVPSYVQQAGGARLLALSEDYAWALVRLNDAPPAGAFFSAWRASVLPTGTSVSVVHHPNGDLKKYAQGASAGYQTFSDGSSVIKAQYGRGTTEGGSGGAALLTFNAAGNFYEVQGALYGGDASCASPSGVDIYSRFDNMLPLMRQYLTPGSNPAGTVVAVEFYNRTLKHYFISTSPAEINDLDSGVHAGWERTGLRFLAYATQVAGTSPVCRFYRAPAFGDSHFYSASPAECAATAAGHPVDWIYESPNVFYIPLPDTTTGACPVNTLPIWRFFNQVTTNHRYTADVTLRDRMRADSATWIPEGYGNDAVIMCTPVGS